MARSITRNSQHCTAVSRSTKNRNIFSFFMLVAQWPRRSAVISHFVSVVHVPFICRFVAQLFRFTFKPFCMQFDSDHIGNEMKLNSKPKTIKHKQNQDNDIEVNWMTTLSLCTQHKTLIIKIDEIMTGSINEWLLHNALADESQRHRIERRTHTFLWNNIIILHLISPINFIAVLEQQGKRMNRSLTEWSNGVHCSCSIMHWKIKSK